MQNGENNEDIQLVSDSQNKAAVCATFVVCILFCTFFGTLIKAGRVIHMLKHQLWNRAHSKCVWKYCSAGFSVFCLFNRLKLESTAQD